MIRIIAIVFMCFTLTGFYSQNVEDLIRNTQNYYKKATNLEYYMVYELYKGHKSTALHSSYNGYHLKNDGKAYVKIKNTEFLYDKNLTITASNEEKIIQLTVGQNVEPTEIELSTLLKEIKLKKVEESDSHYLITLVYHDNTSTPYSMVKLKINKKSNFIDQFDIFYSIQQDFSVERGKNDMHFPHLRIKFKGYNVNVKKNDDRLARSTYINSNNGVTTLSGRFSKYELIDNRTKY